MDSRQESSTAAQRDLRITAPDPEDGYAVHQLIAACPPLDPNSIYCNLLQCTHFAGTAAKAMLGDELVGFVSGYRVPERSKTLFVWQIAVSQQARGMGLAGRLLSALLERESLADIRYLENTITPDNEASWGLFRRLAEKLEAGLETQTIFSRDAHFGGKHEDEVLLRIGPIKGVA